MQGYIYVRVPDLSKTGRICDFDASPHIVALISAVHKRNRALRDREAHSKGAQTGFVISMLFPAI